MQSLKFVPLVYATVIATSASMGRTVIEARISEGSAVHDSQTLIARGTGRDYYVNKQAIAVSPTGSPGEFATTYNTQVSLWVKDLTQSTVVASGGHRVGVGLAAANGADDVRLAAWGCDNGGSRAGIISAGVWLEW